MKKIITLIFCASFVACAPAINQKNLSAHRQAAQSALQNNDWDAARVHWAKAVVNGELGNAPDSQMAILYYEYGRALGVTCFYNEAEKYLKKAYNLDEKTNGPVYMTLLELARLNLNQKKYDNALHYFDKLMPVLEKINAKSQSPAELSVVLDEYSEALTNMDMLQRAKQFKAEAKKMRETFSGAFSITDRTPYGSQCVDKDSL